MTNVRKIIVAALFLLPSSAFAHEYGTPGTIELGGFFAATSQSDKIKNGSKTDITIFQVTPEVGYYVSEGLVLIGQLPLEAGNLKDDQGSKASITQFGVGVGGGYFMHAGIAHVGPTLVAHYKSNSFKFDLGGGSTTVAENSPGAEIGLRANVPVGQGGLITAGLLFDYDSIDQKISGGGFSQKASGSGTSFGTAVGVLIFF